MDLTDEQKGTISEWVASGATLNDVQERLKEEFEITITYLETRFLIADLGLELQEDKEETVEEAESEAEADAAMEEPPVAEESDVIEGGGPDALGGSGVSVTVDSITQPGTMVSGKVTFSDGQSAAWYLDQLGRLGLNPDKEGYRPSEEDIVAFQQELQKAVR